MYPKWPSQELCAMLGQRARDPLLVLPPSPRWVWLWHIRFDLLSWLVQKRRERWEEAVNSIDFPNSSRKAWSTINKLTGRCEHSFRLRPVSANSIASWFLKNGTHKTGTTSPQGTTTRCPTWVRDFSVWPIRSEPFRSEPFRSRDFSVLVVSVSRHFAQNMKSCRNLTCPFFNANVLKSTKSLISKYYKHDPRSNS